MPNVIDGDVIIRGTIRADGLTLTSGTITDDACASGMGLQRSKMKQETSQPFSIPLTAARVHDDINSLLPGTAAADDLALDGSTLGALHITAGDLKAAGSTTRRLGIQAHLPPEYDDGQTVYIRCRAGMQTTAADTSCTVGVECHKSDEDGSGGSDICTTAALDMNNTTFADKDFAITPTGLESGDTLDLRITVTCNDGATGTVVEPTIGAIKLLCDIRG